MEWRVRFLSVKHSVSLKTGEAARPVCQPVAEWMIPGHSTAPLPLPRWYFSTAKCHINIRCQLINLSSHETRWHLTSCWNTDDSIAGPLLLKHICPECSYGAVQTLCNLMHPFLLKFFRRFHRENFISEGSSGTVCVKKTSYWEDGTVLYSMVAVGCFIDCRLFHRSCRTKMMLHSAALISVNWESVSKC